MKYTVICNAIITIGIEAESKEDAESKKEEIEEKIYCSIFPSSSFDLEITDVMAIK